jgi:hypothetical protein
VHDSGTDAQRAVRASPFRGNIAASKPPLRLVTGRTMKLQRLMPLLIGLAALDCQASAGLTGAGIAPQQQPAGQGEPTLAQVAPVAGTNAGAPVVSIAGNPVPGTPTVASGGAANAPGTNAPAPAAATKPVTPPPPPDPATLPVSVIRPVNKAATDTTSTAPPAATSAPPAIDTAPATPQAPAGREPRAAPANGAKAATGSTNLPVPTSRVAASSPPRPEPAPRAVPETPPQEPADASSSGFIFYTGAAIAAVVLMLSFGAFMRGSRDDGT